MVSYSNYLYLKSVTIRTCSNSSHVTGPEWDSSDEEIVEAKPTKKIAKKKKGSAAKIRKAKVQAKQNLSEDASNVIYMGHLPKAFEEPEILTFLSQFGKVTNIKLSRSQRTGNPRGYAFVEFAEKEVAAIVAETMSGYLLMGERSLVCHLVPKDKIHPELFKGAKGNLAVAQTGRSASDYLNKIHEKQREMTNATRTGEQLKKITKRLLSRERKKRAQLKELGIDYDFPGYDAPTTSASKNTEKKEAGKKRKVSVDEDIDMEEVKTPKKVKKTKTPKKTSKSNSAETPSSKKKATKKPETEVKKTKSKSKSKRRSL